MTERDKFREAIRAAAGANENYKDTWNHITINGNVGCVLIQKKGVSIHGVEPQREAVPLNWQNFTPSSVIRKVLESFPPSHCSVGCIIDHTVGSGAFAVTARTAADRPL